MLGGGFEQLLDDLAGAPTRRADDAVFGGEGTQLLDGLRRVHRHADGVLDEIDHAGLLPWLGQIDRLVVDGDHGGADGLAGSVDDEFLGEGDDVADVGEGLVRLHHRELGVVAGADALVAEHAPDLEDALHAADDEPLEVQLQRDPQVQGHVERVVVGDERTSVRSAGLHVQHRCLHLDVAVAVQGAPEAGDDRVAYLEGPAGFFVHDEVGVTLAVAGVGVGEALPLVGHGSQRLREQLEPIDLHAEFALTCGHHDALGPHPVAEVEIADLVERFVADNCLGDEQLDLVGAVAQRGEDELALFALEHHPPGDGHAHLGLGAGLERTVRSADLGQRVRAIEAIGVWVVAERPHVVELGQALGLLGRQTTTAEQVGFGFGGGGGCVVHRTSTVSGRAC
ncbi:unannotated protein [freshwater metagenome]|uniref:Unannotated protein n=1 Tax=freshwater metagenome TaxID=449393 RepID=A0A6J7FTA3_9ZZZZ